MSDPKLDQWLKKHGVQSVKEAQGVQDGETLSVTEKYITPDSEMDQTLSAELHSGDKVRIHDLYGFNVWYSKADLDAYITKAGKLSTWTDFENLGMSNIKEVKPPTGYED